MKKILIAILLLFTFTGGVALSDSLNGLWHDLPIVKLTSQGQPLEASDSPAVILNNHTYVPLAALQSLGVQLTWDQSTYSVDIKLPEIVKIVHPALSQDKLNEIAKSVYEVFGSTDDPKIANQGSGFIIGDNIMVSNYHVAGASKIVQFQIDGLWYNVSQENYSFANKTNDLMGFKVVGGNPLPYSTTLPEVGSVVYAIGYPKDKLSITSGLVTNIVSVNKRTMIEFDAPIDNGDSGGALIDGQGQVIGIITSGYTGTSKNQALPLSYMQDELNKLK